MAVGGGGGLGGFRIPLDFVKNGVKCTLLLGFDATKAAFIHSFEPFGCRYYPPDESLTAHKVFHFFWETKDFVKNKNWMPLELRSPPKERPGWMLRRFERVSQILEASQTDDVAALLEIHTLL